MTKNDAIDELQALRQRYRQAGKLLKAQAIEQAIRVVSKARDEEPTMKNGPSTTDKLGRFFDDNPQEELTLPQIAAKFGCAPSTAELAIRELRQDGRVEKIFVVRKKQAVG